MFHRSLWQKFHRSYLNLWSHKMRKCSTFDKEKRESDLPPMLKSVNEVKLLGYIGVNPGKYEKSNGSFITFFKMATNRFYLDKSDTLRRITTWHSVIVKKPSVQDYVLKYLSKGVRVYVSGYLDNINYDLYETHVMGPVHVVAEEVIFLKRPRTSQLENSPFFYELDERDKKF